MKKLLNKDLKEYRKLQWEKQKGICPICRSTISFEESVLDHDHTSGHCRRVLCNACNQIEGKIIKAFKRFIGYKNIITPKDLLINLVEYYRRDYSNNPIHPTELTDLEKELKSVNKKLKSLKRPSTVLQYKERAKELRKLIKLEREQNSWRLDDDIT